MSNYNIVEDDAQFLINGCGVFVLSNDNTSKAVVFDPEIALTQNDFKYVAGFLATGGAPLIMLKCVGKEVDQEEDVLVWTKNF